MAVHGDIQWFVGVGGLEHFEDVVGWGRLHDGGGDELVHCFVVGGFGGIVDEAGAAAVDGAGEECHADGSLARDALEGADEVGAFEVLSLG